MSIEREFQTSESVAASYETFQKSRQVVANALEQPRFSHEVFDTVADELYARRTEDLSVLPASEQAERINSRALTVLPVEELERRLIDSQAYGKPLKIKYGIDPTGADVHLGHAVPMILLDRFQRMGHDVTFIVGSFTAKIGDPSGRVDSRPVLDDEQVAAHMQTYKQQVAPLFNIDQVELLHNGDWLNKLTFPDLIRLVGPMAVSQVMQREDFQNRANAGLTFAETIYPLAMAIDSVHVEADIEVGGKDQLLNIQMGREVMRRQNMQPQVAITTDIILGTDGKEKMSKSLGNYVALSDAPNEIFGKLMSIPDTQLESYFKMLTEIEDTEWQQLANGMADGSVNPSDVKKLLAFDMTQALHGKDAATHAKKDFEARFKSRSYKEMEDVPELTFDLTERIVPQIVAAVSEIRKNAASTSELNRMMKQRGVRVITADEEEIVVEDAEALDTHLPQAAWLRIGKRLVFKVDT